MVGNTLSHYRIVEELGRGGMGIVYRAEDAKLDRTVAIKVLPSAALASEDDRVRFYREAKAAARLHHPHIASVFEIDEAVPSDAPHGTEPSPFIAMEFIDGEPLSDRIKRGPLKLGEAVGIAVQIARALEAAHEAEIVHRDIKAQNVMLTSRGEAKVLDFGLALTAASTKLTRMGSTLGTVAYMSPEQARGEEVDSRTDLWSLGVVLYEMIAGRLPFPGDYEQAVVYEILNQDPEPLTALRTGVPMELERIVGKCLRRKAASRYHTAADLLVDLKNVDATDVRTATLSVTRPRDSPELNPEKHRGSDSEGAKTAAGRHWALNMLAAFALLALGWFLSNTVQEKNPDESTSQLWRLPIHVEGYTNLHGIDISPTQEYISFTGTDSQDQEQLLLFETSSMEIIPISNSQGARLSIFSPDGRRLAFEAGTSSFVVEVPRGAPQLIDTGRPMVWEDNANILLYRDHTIWRHNIVDRDTSIVGDTSSPGFEGYFQIRSILPGSRIGLGFRMERDQRNSSYFLVDLETGIPQTLRPGISMLQYVPGGYLAYVSQGWSGEFNYEPIDSETGELLGGPVKVMDCMTGRGFAVGAQGSLVYIPQSASRCGDGRRLHILDLENREVTLLDELPALDESPIKPSYSRDGRFLAYEAGRPSAPHVSVIDLETGLSEQITFTGTGINPTWSTDGSELFYVSLDPADSGIFRQPRIDSGRRENVIRGRAFNPAISNNGQWMAYSKDNGFLYLYDLVNGADIPIDTSSTGLWDPAFSPGDDYVAYNASPFGENEFVIRSIDGSFVRRNSFGGSSPVWSPDGTYIYFIEGNSFISRAPITTTPVFEFTGEPERIARISGGNISMDISPDGNHLAISADDVSPNVNQQADVYSTIVWWQNWAQSLSRD